ncbi:MAG: DUF296 domain-containing protein [Desulfobacterales bacterium]|nr:DUF296 domain-containing protein [Desulfobacterales bacterium]
MEDADRIVASEFTAGRSMMGRLPWGKDLIKAVEDFCADHSIKTAVFSIVGSVTSATLGSFDHNQQVYVTFKKEEALEIVHCTGNVSLKNGKPAVNGHGVFADIDGRTVGGHIFSETMVYAAEIYFQELVGGSLTREYDEQTGLFLWKL